MFLTDEVKRHFSQPTSSLRPLALLLAFRVVNALLVMCPVHPDEFFQSLEVAFRLVFGYGELTWEWRAEHRIRSFLHPLFHAAGYAAIRATVPDGAFSKLLITTVPRLQQAAINALGDYFLWRLTTQRYGVKAGYWALFLSLTSWYLFSVGVHTLSNSLEAPAFIVGLYLWHNERFLGSALAMAVATTLRSTSVIPIFVSLLVAMPQSDNSRLQAALIYTTVASFTISGIIGLDTWGARVVNEQPWLELTFSPWNFLKRNVIDGVSAYYGTSAFLQYFVLWWPLMLGPAGILGLAMLTLNRYVKPHSANSGAGEKGAKKQESPSYINFDKVCDAPIIVTTVVLSLLGHKELRFLAPLLPLAFMRAASIFSDSQHGALVALTRLRSPFCGNKMAACIKSALFCGVVANFAACVYFSGFHKSGVTSVTKWLRTNINETSDSIFVIAPCHSLPSYSQIIHNVPFAQLSCEPYLANKFEDKIFDDVNNDGSFYNKTSHEILSWNWEARWRPLRRFNTKSMKERAAAIIENRISKGSKDPWAATIVIIFEPLFVSHGHIGFLGHDYIPCARFFNGFFETDARKRGDIIVLCKRSRHDALK